MSENQKFNDSEELFLPEGEEELFLPKGEEEQTANIEEENLTSQNEKLELSRKIISEEAEDKKKFETELEDDNNTSIDNKFISQESANNQAKQNLQNIRKELSTSDKAISRIVHSPVIGTLSEKSSESIARPSGLLGGAILAFFGSLAYLIFVKYVGITYNYLLFFGFFIIGFIIGLVIEFLIKLKRN